MTRWQHFIHALVIAWRLQKATLAVIIHAFIPRLFTKYATNEMQNILMEKDK